MIRLITVTCLSLCITTLPTRAADLRAGVNEAQVAITNATSNLAQSLLAEAVRLGEAEKQIADLTKERDALKALVADLTKERDALKVDRACKSDGSGFCYDMAKPQ